MPEGVVLAGRCRRQRPMWSGCRFLVSLLSGVEGLAGFRPVSMPPMRRCRRLLGGLSACVSPVGCIRWAACRIWVQVEEGGPVVRSLWDHDCHETLYTKPSFRNTALLATLPVYLFIYAFVHFCPLSVYACFAPSYMPGSYSHIYLFSIATHHALWFSVAIIAPHSIALTHPPTTLITDLSTSQTSTPLV